jgi:hypothetical protein
MWPCKPQPFSIRRPLGPSRSVRDVWGGYIISIPLVKRMCLKEMKTVNTKDGSITAFNGKDKPVTRQYVWRVGYEIVCSLGVKFVINSTKHRLSWDANSSSDLQ